MKTELHYSSRALLVCVVLFFLPPCTMNSQIAKRHPNIISSSGTHVPLFSGIKSDLFSGIYRSGPVRNTAKCRGQAPPTVSGNGPVEDLIRYFQPAASCLPDDVCAGSYIAIIPVPLGVCRDPETGFSCDVHNFMEDLSGTCVDGEFNTFVECGTNNCCIDAKGCINEIIWQQSLNCGPPWNHQWNPETCECEWYSPVLIDLLGDGFQLTSAGAGVRFDSTGTGQMQQIAWTAEHTDDAFLVLDRSGDGIVNNGFELFGNYTPQPNTDYPNGFSALAEYDKIENGGNHDGVMDSRDAIFGSLLLWVDSNHNGMSEPNELFPLHDLGVYTISLQYKESAKRDRYGNEFRFRAKINEGMDTERWAYDVFLTISEQHVQ